MREAAAAKARADAAATMTANPAGPETPVTTPVRVQPDGGVIAAHTPPSASAGAGAGAGTGYTPQALLGAGGTARGSTGAHDSVTLGAESSTNNAGMKQDAARDGSYVDGGSQGPGRRSLRSVSCPAQQRVAVNPWSVGVACW